MSTRSDSITALLSVVSAEVVSTLIEDLATHLADAGDSLKEKLEEYFAVEGQAPPPPKGKGGKAAAKPAAAKGGKKPAAAAAAESKVEGELVVVLNYGPKSHAIFGPTADIKDKLMALNKVNGKLVGYQSGLFFGPGWTITNKERLEEVTAMFTENGLEFREVERKEYEVEVGGKAAVKAKAGKPAAKPKAGAKADAPAKAGKPAAKPKAAAPAKAGKPAAKPKAGAKAAAPAKAEPTVALVATKNAWGNSEESDTGIVFMNLPVGVAGRKINVAVGTQDPDADYKVKGLASVIPLSDEMIEECESKKWRVLSDEIMAMLLKKDKPTHTKLAAMIAAGAEEKVEEEVEEEAEDEEEPAEAEEEEEEVEAADEEGDGDDIEQEEEEDE